MATDTRERAVLDILYPYQKRYVECPARFTWNNWSRQTGKTFTSTLRRVLRGARRKRNQIFLSAGERQSRELMMKAKVHVQAMQLHFTWNEHDLFEGTSFKQLEINVPKLGIRIIGLPANPNTARGFTGDVLLDEFAMHKHDREIWAAIFPTVTRGGGELDVCSTPKGRQNMFYMLRDNGLFEHGTVTIEDAIADGWPANVEELRKGIFVEEIWKQEYLCQFVDETTAFLTYERIGECEDPALPRDLDVEALAECTGDVVVGIDIGRKHDLTVVWVFEIVGSLLISRGMLELKSMRFREQFETICSVLKNRCVRRVCVDNTGLGMQLAEELQERFGSFLVEPCTFTPAFKQQAAGELRIRHEDRQIRYAVDPDIRNDLHSVRKTVTAAGNIRLDAPREEGSHADRFWAAALACHAGSDAPGPIEATFGPDRHLAKGGAW